MLDYTLNSSSIYERSFVVQVTSDTVNEVRKFRWSNNYAMLCMYISLPYRHQWNSLDYKLETVYQVTLYKIQATGLLVSAMMEY